MRFSEYDLIRFSKPISDTEETRCINALNMVSDALVSEGFVKTRGIELSVKGTYGYDMTLRKGNTDLKLLVQGSYANNTNVRGESDVDIAVIQLNTFNTLYRSGVTDANYGFTSSSCNFLDYKTEIHKALVLKFGTEGVEWKNKCIHVKGNSYRVNTDTVPARRYRNYSKDYNNDRDNFIGGIYIKTDKGEIIINYPEQHIANGREKNVSSNLYYKKNVRIIKRIRYLMIDDGVASASKVNSFMLESLLWNLPDYKYQSNDSYVEKFTGLINYVTYLSIPDNSIDNYYEVNGIKKLLDTKEKKNDMILFLNDLRKYMGII